MGRGLTARKNEVTTRAGVGGARGTFINKTSFQSAEASVFSTTMGSSPPLWLSQKKKKTNREKGILAKTTNGKGEFIYERSVVVAGSRRRSSSNTRRKNCCQQQFGRRCLLPDDDGRGALLLLPATIGNANHWSQKATKTSH
jgi:hypothetical protein